MLTKPSLRSCRLTRIYATGLKLDAIVAKTSSSLSAAVKYGSEMGLLRINRSSRVSLILASIVALLLLVLLACDDGDDGFRADPRSENQSSNQPDNQQNDHNQDNSPEPDSETQIKEGELPGRDHGDRTHGI